MPAADAPPTVTEPVFVTVVVVVAVLATMPLPQPVAVGVVIAVADPPVTVSAMLPATPPLSLSSVS